MVKCSKCGKKLGIEPFGNEKHLYIVPGYNVCNKCNYGLGWLVTNNYVTRKEQPTLKGWTNYG